MKTVGIIGGLGPETTAKFYLEVLSSCFKTNKINRPPMIVFNVPMRFDLEREIIVEAKGKNRLLPFLIDAAKHLEKGGADFIVIPCNTAHVFIEEVKKSVSIPVISIVEEAVKFLVEKNIGEVGLLATTQTVDSKLFDGHCAKKGIKINKPSSKNQSGVSSIVTKVLQGEHNASDEQRLLKIVDSLDYSDCILLACTDLQLLMSEHKNLKVFDTMKILADATVREILKGGD